MQIVVLDIRTLSFITMSSAFLFSIGLYGFGRTQKKFKGFTALAAANAAIGFGMLLLAYRDVLSDFLTIVVANTLFVVALVLYFEGVRRFFGTFDRVNPIGVVAVILTVGLIYYFTFPAPSVNARILTTTAIFGGISSLATREFLRDLSDYWKMVRIMLAILFGSYTIFQVYRFIWTLGESPIHSFMTAGTVHSITFIVTFLLTTGLTFGMIWLVSVRLEIQLTELANNDQLTQILNRRGVDNLAAMEFSKVKRSKAAMALMMVDLDHFKKLNDTYGHQVGDEILAGFSRLIRRNLRPHDIFGRVGGEEFLILLSNTQIEQALALAERLRHLVETAVFEVDEHQIQITASFGVANYVPATNTLEKLMPYADKALYMSKQSGRNKVTYLLPEVETAAEMVDESVV